MKQLYILLILLFSTGWYANAQDDVLKYSLKTRWADQVDPNNVWPEYPRPQMKRNNWQNLNGYWEYAILPTSEAQPSTFHGQILVPFAAESELSGVKKLVGENNNLWYKRTFKAPELDKNERLLLHFGAVDWDAVVFINGKEAGSHKGGYDAFDFDITDYLKKGDQEVVVRVWDPSDKGTQARGKQVSEPFGIWYTPVTGIWQTVWLEKVPEKYVDLVKVTPDIDKRTLNVKVKTNGTAKNQKLTFKAFADDKEVSNGTVAINGNNTSSIDLEIPEPRLWTPEDPYLYDLVILLTNDKGKEVDKVESYFGMRKVSLGKDSKGYTRIMLNNKPLFQFGLLDQGWWPDGLYTAPSEEAMLYDVKMTKEMGFNMLRKHVKVEPARFYYNCDKMGMLVWQDMPNGNYLRGLRIQAWEKEDAQRPKESAVQFEEELKEMMDQFHSFPSILVWVPFNEGWGQYETERITEWSKNYDPSRLIDSPSGWSDRGIGDVIDVHLYPGPGMEAAEENRAAVLGEFGGLGYPVKDHLWWDKKNWGYLTYQDKAEFETEFENLISSLKGLLGSGLSAAIYTQTTDVEGEVNGILTYDREVTKIDPDKLRSIIQPLYSEYWDSYTYVSDSEYQPNKWQITFTKPQGDWTLADYDDFSWEEQNAPFSTYENPFLENATEWKTDKMYVRKEFHVETLPENLYLKHYLPKASVKIYLNGQLIKEQEDKGGRKRHYTDIDISNFASHLNEGENVLAVEVEKMDKNASFDVGLYTTEEIKNDEARAKSEKIKASLPGGGSE